jgi:hypothetical protein
MPWRRVGEWRYSSTIVHFGARWRWMVRFTPRPLYARGNNSPYPLDRRLCGIQIQSGRSGVKKNLSPLPGIKPRPSSLLPVAIPTDLSRYSIRISATSSRNLKKHSLVQNRNMTVQIPTLYFLKPCSLVGAYRRFGGTYCFIMVTKDVFNIFFVCRKNA